MVIQGVTDKEPEHQEEEYNDHPTAAAAAVLTQFVRWCVMRGSGETN